MIILGILFSSYNLMTVGIWFFCAVIFFQLVTLPVEFNASGRAVRELGVMVGMMPSDKSGAAKVLRAAAMTYVAALATSLLQLLRLLAIRGRRS
jgi:hypothetical protein